MLERITIINEATIAIKRRFWNGRRMQIPEDEAHRTKTTASESKYDPRVEDAASVNEFFSSRLAGRLNVCKSRTEPIPVKSMASNL